MVTNKGNKVEKTKAQVDKKQLAAPGSKQQSSTSKPSEAPSSTAIDPTAKKAKKNGLKL